MNSLYPVICTEDVAACSVFYQELLGLKPVFEADWFVQLQAPSNPLVEIAFVQRAHPSVPKAHQNAAAGVLITIELDNVDEIHTRAIGMNLPIVLGLRDEAWGQRHFITQDPTGLLLDVVKVIPAAAEFTDNYAIG